MFNIEYHSYEMISPSYLNEMFRYFALEEDSCNVINARLYFIVEKMHYLVLQHYVLHDKLMKVNPTF